MQLLRSYQSKGLLPPPRHEGRVAWYGPHHRERLLHIRHLKERGYSLRMVAQALHDGGDSAAPLIDEHEVLRLGEVAERSGVPVEVLRALEASGL
ncbi:MAG TPA: helix-turn-helix domain-containing protein, partial [Acidimicrobiales bacterium]|nr:helix-turn-helix domain-containing protein [Acidimicrobiales bacterium]